MMVRMSASAAASMMWLMPPDEPKEVEAPHRRFVRVEWNGTPQLDVHRPVERRRHDADDCERPTIHRNRLADCPLVAGQATLPEAVAEDGDVVLAVFFVGEERAAAIGRDAERGEKVCARDGRPHALGRVTASDDRAAVDRECAERREHRIALAVVEVIRRRYHRLVALLERPVHVHELVGPLVGKRLDKHGVHDAEHRAVCADADGERRDHQGREHRPFHGAADSVLDVLKHRG